MTGFKISYGSDEFDVLVVYHKISTNSRFRYNQIEFKDFRNYAVSDGGLNEQDFDAGMSSLHDNGVLNILDLPDDHKPLILGNKPFVDMLDDRLTEIVGIIKNKGLGGIAFTADSISEKLDKKWQDTKMDSVFAVLYELNIIKKADQQVYGEKTRYKLQ